MRCRIFLTAVLALSVLACAPSALADERERVLCQLREIDREVELRGLDIIWMAEAAQICTALTSGLGLALAGPDDPRELLYEAELSGAPRFERPEGYAPCECLVLTTTASDEDIRIFVQLFDPEAGRVVIPPPPVFASGDLSPTILGLQEDAAITEIGPRFAQLMSLCSGTEAAAQRDYHARISILHADASERDADAVRALADAIA